ncbi:MAG: hypothetical protein CMI31_12355 [Opitutae bacterium]|nr:hypothetical protein [Opitutae bacterium]|tara:strand:- start:3427 stop:4098 length:672 start_codon:yes stop_codon:yes gene_type:complete
MTDKAIILASEEIAETIFRIAECETGSWEFTRADSIECLTEHFETEEFDLLFSFGTSVIVPGWILAKPDMPAVNLHAASPQYPGRDPHHFAIYDGVPEYGATLHFMTPSVDSGPIIDVEIFDVPDGTRPVDLLDKANEAAFMLLGKYLPMLLSGEAPPSNPNLQWTGTKRSRKDFLELCRIDPEISEEEFLRRQRACQMPGYYNLHTMVQGRRFHMLPDAEKG